MTGADMRARRYGYTEVSRQLVERAGVDVLPLAISDALKAAGMTEGDGYYVRVSVIELPPEKPLPEEDE